jgi:hypothetical protein
MIVNLDVKGNCIGPSWEANSRSACQEIPRLLWNPKAYYSVRNYPEPDESIVYESVSISFRNGRLERELQMVQLSATRCSCIAILWVSLVSSASITFCAASQRVPIIVVYFVMTQSGNVWIYPRIFTPSFFQRHFSVVLPSTPSSSKWSLPFGISDYNFYEFLIVFMRAACSTHHTFVIRFCEARNYAVFASFLLLSLS